MAIQQKTRPIGLKTPLGEDVLLLKSMSGDEHLGRLFHYELTVLSTDESIKMDDILGQNVTVWLDLGDDKQRFFNGYVSRFSQTGRSATYATYQLTLRPWLWFLTRRKDCRIFQEMTAPDIIKKVFRDAGFTDFEASLSASYRQRDYCVQYRETDFDFVSRLAEQEGIYYYFKHEDGKHTLVLCDSYGAHSMIPDCDQVPYFPPTENVAREEDYIDDWAITQEVMPGVCSLTDFDFEKPKVDLATRSKIERKHSNAGFEQYDFPGDYLEEDDGKAYARTRMEELACQHEQVHGAGDVKGFTPGGLFGLSGYPREDQNREHLLIGVTCDLRSSEFETAGGGTDGLTYRCRFTAIESQTPYRTPRFTPKPVVQGPQTAMVVGKAGEEIWTDKYGRVKVQFHWDREGKRDENSSCWVRVSQPWAGKGWGSVAVPRIGQEVVVDFLEGDPDRPLITGRVYNADAMPPYALPGSAMVSGLKSNSTPGGGGSNEISMNDTKGKEGMTVHAQYDMSTTVEHDETQHIKNDRTITVDGKHTETIDKDTVITIKTGNLTHEVSAGTASYHVKGAVQEKIDDSMDTVVANGIQITSSSAHIYIHMATNIQLHVGSSSIWMDSGGQIAIKGNNITIDGKESVSIHGASVTSKADADHNISGAIVVSEGTGTNTVKGGMVMLNP